MNQACFMAWKITKDIQNSETVGVA